MQYDCPRDSHALREEQASSGFAWRCNTCSGALLTGLMTREIAVRSVAIGPREAWDLEVKCPRDGAKMGMVTLGPVAIDYCKKCGAAWLDGDEVDRLLGTSEAERTKSGRGLLSGFDWSAAITGAIIGALVSGH
jgi:hypothetical protein